MQFQSPKPSLFTIWLMLTPLVCIRVGARLARAKACHVYPRVAFVIRFHSTAYDIALVLWLEERLSDLEYSV
jgi:hypothetical protein